VYLRGRRELAECGNCGESKGCGGPNGRPQTTEGSNSHWDLLGIAPECITQLVGGSSGNACLARLLRVAEGEAGLTICWPSNNVLSGFVSVQWLLIPARDRATNRRKLYTAVESQVSKTARPRAPASQLIHGETVSVAVGDVTVPPLGLG